MFLSTPQPKSQMEYRSEGKRSTSASDIILGRGYYVYMSR